MTEDISVCLSEGNKLCGASNYLQWSSMIMDILESKGLEDTILPTFEKPKIDDSEKDKAKIKAYAELLKVWKINNDKAKLAICSNCQSLSQDLLLNIEDTKTMWSML
jgi:hypothetical protein